MHSPAFHIVWPLYMIVCLLLFLHSAQFMESRARRMKFFTLALALMCFGSARFLWRMNPDSLPQIEWMFTLGHWSLLAFAMLYWLFKQTGRKPR